MKAYSYSITVLLILFAVVQYNDPDPWLWIATYLVFAMLAFSISFYTKKILIHVAAGIAALVWMFFQWPERWEGLGETMNNENVERGREALGLLICSITAFVNSWFIRKSSN